MALTALNEDLGDGDSLWSRCTFQSRQSLELFIEQAQSGSSEDVRISALKGSLLCRRPRESHQGRHAEHPNDKQSLIEVCGAFPRERSAPPQMDYLGVRTGFASL